MIKRRPKKLIRALARGQQLSAARTQDHARALHAYDAS